MIIVKISYSAIKNFLLIKNSKNAFKINNKYSNFYHNFFNNKLLSYILYKKILFTFIIIWFSTTGTFIKFKNINIIIKTFIT